jgi:hypothetical protein
MLGGESMLTMSQRIMKHLLDHSSSTPNGVHLALNGTTYVIIDSRDGYAATAHKNIQQLEVEGSNLISKRGDSPLSVVYDGDKDKFDFSGINIYDKHTTSGNGYRAIKLCEYVGYRGCKIRIQHIVWGMVYGYEVLLAMGGGFCDIHHIKGVAAGNGIENLQMLSSQDHQSMEMSLRWINYRQALLREMHR